MTELLTCPYWFLRHGETAWNAQHLSQGRTDIPLNETGLAQARAAGEALAAKFAQEEQHPFTCIVSSPLKRAFVTAEHVHQAIKNKIGLDLPLYSDADLQEVCFGVQEGQPMGDWYKPWISGEFVPEGGEHFNALRERAVTAINRAHERKEGTPLIVAHGALFRALRHAMDLEVDVRLANAQPIKASFQDTKWHLENYSVV